MTRRGAAPRPGSSPPSAAVATKVERSYTPLHLRAEPELAKPGALPLTERLGGSLVELPCEPSVPLTDVARICEIVRETLRRL